MAQFDVFRTANGELLVDCQSEAFGNLATRLTIPLVERDRAPELRVRLNPVFDLAGGSYALMTQFATAIRSSELRTKVDTLADRRFDIIGAVDMLLTGV